MWCMHFCHSLSVVRTLLFLPLSSWMLSSSEGTWNTHWSVHTHIWGGRGVGCLLFSDDFFHSQILVPIKCSLALLCACSYMRQEGFSGNIFLPKCNQQLTYFLKAILKVKCWCPGAHQMLCGTLWVCSITFFHFFNHCNEPTRANSPTSQPKR